MSADYPAPRPYTGRPARAVPAGACDCHAHVFGDDRYPMIEARSYTPHLADLGMYRAMLAGLGFERMVLVQASIYGTDNRCMLDALRSVEGDVARGIAVVDRSVTEEELRNMDAQGVRGLRFNALTQGGAAMDDLPELAERIAPLGWHIQLWVTPDTLVQLAPLLQALPLDVVLDHVAQLDPDPALMAQQTGVLQRLMDGGRTWIKLSAYRISRTGHPYHDVRLLTRRLIESWPERCVWGSDWPHPMLAGRMPYDNELVDLLDGCMDRADVRHKILVDNPARLYGFPD